MLSWASLLVLVVATVFLQSTEEFRTVFRLPFRPWLLALGAGLVSAGITLVCRDRPGTRWPKVWLLLLTTLCFGIAIADLIDESTFGTPLVAALSTSTAASVFILLVRIVRLRPDSRFLHRLTPLAFVLALAAATIAPYWLGKSVVRREASRVDARIEELRTLARNLEDLAGDGWPGLMISNKAEAVRRVEGLRALRVPSDVASLPGLWVNAGILHRTDDLAKAYQSVFDQIPALLQANHAPLMTQIDRELYRWDIETKQWKTDERLQTYPPIISGYHQSLIRILDQLRPSDKLQEAAVSAIRAQYRTKAKEVGSRLSELEASWSDHWLARLPPEVEPGDAVKKIEPVPLETVLKAPLVPGGTLSAGRLWELMHLPLGDAVALGNKKIGCFHKQYPEMVMGNKGGSQEKHFARLDCYAYEPVENGQKVRLRIEARIVYASDTDRMDNYLLPIQTYFIFYTANPQDREDVMHALKNIALGTPGLQVEHTSRTGASLGFSVSDAVSQIKVTNPQDEKGMPESAFKIQSLWVREPPTTTATFVAK